MNALALPATICIAGLLVACGDSQPTFGDGPTATIVERRRRRRLRFHRRLV